MVAHLWFAGDTAAPVSPAYDASWNITTGALRRKLIALPDLQGLQLSLQNETNPAAHNGLFEQYVSDPITTGKTISGTFKMSGSIRTSAAGTFMRAVVRVVSGAGTTVRGTLFSGNSPVEVNVGSAMVTRIVEGEMTPIVAQAGDRIVVERGFFFSNTTSSSVQTIAIRGAPNHLMDDSPISGTNSSFSASWSPWVEFSQDDIWAPVNRRLAGIAAESLIDNPRTSLRVGGVAAESLIDPLRTDLRIGGVTSEVLVDPSRAALRLGGVAVECLIPLDGQRLRTINPVMDVDKEIYVKVPGIGWRAIQPMPAP